MRETGLWSVLNVRLAQVVPLAVATASIGFASPAMAVGTAAGTPITNTANASYTDPGGANVTVTSNQVDIVVDELLDVVVSPAGVNPVIVSPGATDQVLSFTITNTGNGDEAFRLTTQAALGGDQFDPTVTSIFFDNPAGAPGEIGVFDANDIPYTVGTNGPVLTPDEIRHVFVRSSIPAGQADADRGDLDLIAAAATGTGPPGTNFAGQGTNGANAVVGATGADDDARGGYLVQNASVAFVKSASVLDPFGGARSVPGAVITYTLVATTSGSGTLTNLRISDVVPANTTYVASTITLQGAPLTDAADADAGEIATNTVTVRFGNVAGGQTRTVTFRARIN